MRQREHPRMRVIVVGGGVLGTMHAWQALQRGHDVLQIEREPAARGASVRNFGLIWVGGRAEGPELQAALRGRELWEKLGAQVPALGVRAVGSLTVVRTDAETAVARAALNLSTADERGLHFLDASETRRRNPALRGELAGALWCDRDAVVEPRTAQTALREFLLASPGYRWLPGREVRDAADGRVRDDHGEVHAADVVVLCPGASLRGLIRELVPDHGVRRVRLQMMQTEALDEPLSTAVADADSLRYYPAYDNAGLNTAQPQDETARAHGMQLLMVQRRDGGLTIGDSHAYAEPFDFDVDERLYDHLRRAAETVLGRALPSICRRWAGVYPETVDRSLVVARRRIDDHTWLVTGPGGRGMTCSPAIAERTLDEIQELT